MLDDLDRTLATLLTRELPPALVEADSSSRVTISFAAPDSEFTTQVQLPALSLFLYDVQENLELRRVVSSLERQSTGRGVHHLPSARVDCSYLITAWPARIPNPFEDEHRLLGEVMRILMRYRELPREILQGDLRGLEPPLRAFALRPSKLNSLGEFWQAMGGKPRVTLHYTVTITVPVWDPVEMPLVAGVGLRA
ncbi:DUF4255 domain-containing protein [Trichothermofontia sp.]